MPKGPDGEKRPAGVIGKAVGAMQIATGEAEKEYEVEGKVPAELAVCRLGGKHRGSARAQEPLPE